MPARGLVSDVIEGYRKRALSAAFSFKDLVYRLFAFILTTSFILWLSVFIYVTFYYAYVPAISHIRPVHLEFSSCGENVGVCSNPSANITLTHQKQLLQTNQPYNIIVDLELPESEANRQLGMFMIQVRLTGKDGRLVAVSRRSAILRYKSWIVHTISSLIFSPAILAGPVEEKQVLKVDMFTEFMESTDNPVTNVKVEIESRHLQLYSAKLRIQAEFTGLRYFMFYWPVLSATIGIATHVVLLSFLVGYVWYRLLHRNQVVVRVGLGGLPRETSVAVLNSSASSMSLSSSPNVASTSPMVATVEPQQGGTKTLEQRRMEARELLEKQRQIASPPGVFTTRSRSASFNMIHDRIAAFSNPLRIQELPGTPPSEPAEASDKPEAGDEQGLSMSATGLRHRAARKEDP